MTIEVKLDIADVIDALEKLKVASQKTALSAAGTAGAKVWLKLAKEKVHVGTKKKKIRLKDDLKIRRRFSYGEAHFSVGNSKAARHAHLVELGTAPHVIPTPKGSPFSPPGGHIDHPGARPYPFLRPAFNEGKDLCIDRVAKNLSRVIERESSKRTFKRGLR